MVCAHEVGHELKLEHDFGPYPRDPSNQPLGKEWLSLMKFNGTEVDSPEHGNLWLRNEDWLKANDAAMEKKTNGVMWTPYEK